MRKRRKPARVYLDASTLAGIEILQERYGQATLSGMVSLAVSLLRDAKEIRLCYDGEQPEAQTARQATAGDC